MKKSRLVEADGGPLAVVVAAANVNDDRLLEATLEAVVVERPADVEDHLCLDKGYDTPTGRFAAARNGYTTTSDASARRSSTPRGSRALRHAGVWWSERWHG